MSKPRSVKSKASVSRQKRRILWELRQRRGEKGSGPLRKQVLPNRKSPLQTVEEEQAERQRAVEEQLKVLRPLLPRLLRQFAKIPDPRNPQTTKHKLTTLLLYGLLWFVFRMSSRREANRQMSQPEFQKNLRDAFPELETVPHQDTVNRLLSRIPVDQIGLALVELTRRLIRSKKLRRYLAGQHYAIAIDGTQKWMSNRGWAPECLQRHREKEQTQYYVYVLEADLIFPNGLTLPLMSEFLKRSDGDVAKAKQDCELKAFRRLAQRLKACFPHLPVIVVLDGLYPNAPVIQLCRKYHWQFMIVLRDGCLPSAWEEFHALQRLLPEQVLDQPWGNRQQHFTWVNGIEHDDWVQRRGHRVTVHIVVCEEYWKEQDARTGQTVQKTARHAWVSSEPLRKSNVHLRCNLIARHRWGIENHILVEKHHGYQYEHCFSLDWNAMQGFHHLMRLAHALNSLVQWSAALAGIVTALGARGFIQFMRTTFPALGWT